MESGICLPDFVLLKMKHLSRIAAKPRAIT
jgi:hypothetical protein